ncbi:MAG: hypothetical protein RIQ46_533 [Pseudomonadota bacterium]|jgi:uncharacterized SAM-binding protein YcdF (DUF218 family)
MFRRIIALAVLVWLLGFAWFGMALPQPADNERTDAVIVLTGAEGRIPRGLEALEKGWARRMLVSGVAREVRNGEFRAEYSVSRRLMKCCVTLGYESVDTRSNAREAAQWVTENRIGSVRLITTDWHMRRAALEFERTAPAGITVIEDAVASHPSLRTLFLEYNKLLARIVAAAWE